MIKQSMLKCDAKNLMHWSTCEVSFFTSQSLLQQEAGHSRKRCALFDGMFGKKKRLPQNKFSRLVVTGTITFLHSTINLEVFRTSGLGSDRSDVSKSQNDEIRAPKRRTLFHAIYMQNIDFYHCLVCV